MYSITFNCELITPMFMAGADGATPELRPPSIKGALRFWWRAMNGDLVTQKDGKWDYSKLQSKESEIFGDAGDAIGKSKVKIVISKPLIDTSMEDFPSHMHRTYLGNDVNRRSFNINIIDYLAFGPVVRDRELRKNVLIRGYFKEGKPFDITLKIDVISPDEVVMAFFMLAKHGGLGAKSRNGFGSFKIINIEKPKFNNVEIGEEEYLRFMDMKDNFYNTDSYFKGDLKPYTTLNQKSAIFKTNALTNWHSALAILGKKYQATREGFETWHDWYNREIIAMPIMVQGERRQEDNFLERHPKPYFFHITKLGPNAYQGEILCLPYLYLQDHEEHSGKYLKDYHDIVNDFSTRLSLRKIK